MNNREIKFRAWDDKAKEWLCGYELPNLGGFSLWGETILLGAWSDIVGRFLVSQKDREHKDLIVEQFTGLLDKNSKEIYEGDILSDGEEVGEVYFRPCYFAYNGAILGSDEFLQIEIQHKVIGNIHENSELLK